MDYEELKQAAKIFTRIKDIRNYVSKERFCKVAATKFRIDDERKLDIMYGLLNMTQRVVFYIANDCEEYRNENRFPKYMDLMPQTIEIAEYAYGLVREGYGSDEVPNIEHNRYRKEDKRRYFYSENGEDKVIDINLGSRSDIVLLSEVLQREGVSLIGVAEHLGYLEGEAKGYNHEKFQYYEGDIYFLFGDPTDRVFYDWYSHGDDAGVYIATEKGWRKLLYTPGRGYINRDGEVEFVDDEHFYSNYMLEASGKKFQYVGNIHHDISVLIDRKGKEANDD